MDGTDLLLSLVSILSALGQDSFPTNCRQMMFGHLAFLPDQHSVGAPGGNTGLFSPSP